MNQQTQRLVDDDILQYLGLQKLSQDKQDEVLAKIGEIILKKIFIKTVDMLDEIDRMRFEKMLKEGTNATDVENFLKTKIEDYPALIQKIVEDVKNQLPSA